MARWYQVDPHTLNEITAAKPEGGVLTYPSPYDVPRAIRFHCTRNGHVLEVDFKYLTGDEQMIPVRSGQGTVMLGKSSGRIYQVNIADEVADFTDWGPQVAGRINVVIENAVSGSTPCNLPHRDENYRMARTVVNSFTSQGFKPD